MRKVYYIYCSRTKKIEFQHDDYSLIRSEASRLAKQSPGKVFQILGLLSKCCWVEEPSLTWVEVEEDDTPFR